MSLAQESGFKPKTAFRKKTAWDIPTRNPNRAERAIGRLREQFKKSNKREKKQLRDLMYEASRVLIHMARNRRKFNKVEQANFLKIASMYAELKSEFANELGE